MTEKESMWWCPDCKHWVGYKRDRCSCGAKQHVGRTRTDDVDHPDLYCAIADDPMEVMARRARSSRRRFRDRLGLDPFD